MKICYFAPPASVHTRRWLEYMEGKGHDIQLVTIGPRQANWPDRWPIHTLPPDFPGQPSRTMWRLANMTRGHSWVPVALGLWGAIKVRHILKKLAPDLVHVHYIDHLSICALLSDFHPIVATAWGSDFLIQPSQYTRPQLKLLRVALSKADLLTCNSEALRQAAIGFGVKPARIRIRQWGVELKKFGPDIASPERMTAFREKWGINSTSLVLLSPRNPKKPLYCIDGVLRAFRGVLERYPDALLIQLGASSNPKAYAKLKKLAVDLGVDSQVRWLGFIPEEELALVFSLARLTVSLATSDSLPTSLLEAMASGSIPIFSDVGSIHEWIVSGENGWLVPPGDSEALTAAILQALAQPASWWERTRIGNREIIRLRANRTRTLEAMAQDYAMLISDLPFNALKPVPRNEGKEAVI